MKILMLGWELPPHSVGGLGVVNYQLSKAMASLGIPIDFVVPYSADHPTIDFMNVHAATKLPPGYHDLGAYEHGRPEEYDEIGNDYGLGPMRAVQKRYGKFVRNLVKNSPPDVIHAHDWLTIEAGVIAKEVSGAPLIINVHATEYDRSGESLGNPLIHEIEQHGFLMADRIIAVSHLTKQIIVDNYHIPPDKIEVVYNSIDIDTIPACEYDESTYRYLEDLKKDDYTIVGTTARLTVQKGLTYFIRAAAEALDQYDKLAFFVFGNGELRDELIEQAAELGISDKMVFVGFVRGKKFRDAFSLMDVFVMNSISEPFGVTALEAAHYNTALMISNQSGVSEILNSIMKFDYWDTNKIASQIIEIAKSPELKESMKQKAKDEYLRISWIDIAKRFIEIYGELKEVNR